MSAQQSAGSRFVRRTVVAWLLFPCLLLASTQADAATAPTGGDPTREIFELSSIRPQLALVGMQLDGMVLMQSENFPPAGVSTLRTEIARSYSSASLEAEMVPRMRSKLDRAHATKVLNWLRSPLGRRVNGLDTASSSPEAAEKIEIYMDELRQHPPAADRKALIERLISATRYNEATLDLGLSVAAALVMGLQATQPPELRLTPTEVKAQIRSTRDAALLDMAESSTASLHYTYRDLETSELRDFVVFAESDAGRWYHETVWDAAEEALEAVALRVQKHVAAKTDQQAASPPH